MIKMSDVVRKFQILGEERKEKSGSGKPGNEKR